MLIRKIAILGGIGLGLVGAGAYGGATLANRGAVPLAEDKHPHMHDALHDLEAARKHLEEASKDYGGHRLRALDFTNQAADEIYLAIGEKAPERKRER